MNVFLYYCSLNDLIISLPKTITDVSACFVPATISLPMLVASCGPIKTATRSKNTPTAIASFFKLAPRFSIMVSFVRLHCVQPVRFELTTSCFQNKQATWLPYGQLSSFSIILNGFQASCLVVWYFNIMIILTLKLFHLSQIIFIFTKITSNPKRICHVRVTRFERATSATQTQRSDTKLSYTRLSTLRTLTARYLHGRVAACLLPVIIFGQIITGLISNSI